MKFTQTPQKIVFIAILIQIPQSTPSQIKKIFGSENNL